MTSERAIVELWRRGHLSWSTIQVYLHWVRRFRAYRNQRKLAGVDQAIVGRCAALCQACMPGPG